MSIIDNEIIHCNCLTKTPEFKYHKKSCPHRLSEENAILREALQIYANQDHIIGELDDWDSCSGEPLNVLYHEEISLGIENGACARFALEQANLSK